MTDRLKWRSIDNENASNLVSPNKYSPKFSRVDIPDTKISPESPSSNLKKKLKQTLESKERRSMILAGETYKDKKIEQKKNYLHSQCPSSKKLSRDFKWDNSYRENSLISPNGRSQYTASYTDKSEDLLLDNDVSRLKTYQAVSPKNRFQLEKNRVSLLSTIDQQEYMASARANKLTNHNKIDYEEEIARLKHENIKLIEKNQELMIKMREGELIHLNLEKESTKQINHVENNLEIIKAKLTEIALENEDLRSTNMKLKESIPFLAKDYSDENHFNEHNMNSSRNSKINSAKRMSLDYDRAQNTIQELRDHIKSLENTISKKVSEQVALVKKRLEYDAQVFKSDELQKYNAKLNLLNEKMFKLQKESAFDQGELVHCICEIFEWDENITQSDLLDKLKAIKIEAQITQKFHKRLFKMMNDLTPAKLKPASWDLKSAWKWIRNLLTDYMEVRNSNSINSNNNSSIGSSSLIKWNNKNKSEELYRMLGAESMRDAADKLSEILVENRELGRVFEKLQKNVKKASSKAFNIKQLEDCLDNGNLLVQVQQ